MLLILLVIQVFWADLKYHRAPSPQPQNITNNFFPQATPKSPPYYTQLGPSNQTSSAPSGGGSQNVGCSPSQGVGGLDISNIECHDASSGEKDIPREESHVHQPDSGNFTYSTVVTIPCDEKPDDVTIEFNGKEHRGASKTEMDINS